MQRTLMESLLMELHWPAPDVVGAAMRRMAYKADRASSKKRHQYTSRGRSVSEKEHAQRVLKRLQKRVTRSTDLDYKEQVLKGAQDFDTAARRTRFVGNMTGTHPRMATHAYKLSRSWIPAVAGAALVGGAGAYAYSRYKKRQQPNPRPATPRAAPTAAPQPPAVNYPFRD